MRGGRIRNTSVTRHARARTLQALTINGLRMAAGAMNAKGAVAGSGISSKVPEYRPGGGKVVAVELVTKP